MTEKLRFPLQPFGDSVAHAVLDRLECGEWGGIMSAGFLQHLFARGAIDKAPAQRIAIEQKAHDAAAALALRSPAAGHPPCGADRDLGEDRGSDQLVHHSQPKCFRRALRFAGQNHVERSSHADEPRETLAATGRRQNPELDFRQADLRLRVIGGHAIVTGERKLEPTAEAGAVDTDGDGLRKSGEAIQHFLPIGR